MTNKDTYKTITKPSEEVLFKDRGSKFFGYAFPVKNEAEIEDHIAALKSQHHKARHWCYAWQLGKEYDRFRANDDGEPSNSAGMPIYGQLQSFEVTNTLVVVVRYFGGTKLGVGGLIQAYKTAAQMALEKSRIVTRTIDEEFLVTCDYPEMNTVMRIIKEEELEVLHQELHLDCQFTLSVRKRDADRIFEIFENTYKITIKNLSEEDA
ncbi:YigZ family protein [Flavobacteriaceae bacterium TK19130]|nr:YigZ family protein [Thermobacterium salinum]